jgi:hypothetical protein
MVSGSQIREQLARFLGGQIELEAFEAWFARNTRNIHQSGSVSAENMTFAIEESLSEYSSRHIDEQELSVELAAILGEESSVVEVLEVPQQVYRFRSSAPAVLIPLMV